MTMPYKWPGRRRAEEAEYLTSKLVGSICSRCQATLATIATCPTRLLQRCPGFLSIERTLADYRREQRRQRH